MLTIGVYGKYRCSLSYIVNVIRTTYFAANLRQSYYNNIKHSLIFRPVDYSVLRT